MKQFFESFKIVLVFLHYVFRFPLKLLVILFTGKTTYKNKDGYCLERNLFGKDTYEHRTVACKALGRSLKTNEVVHHINHKRWDNRAQNLCVMTWHSHVKWHKDWAELKGKGIFLKTKTRRERLVNQYKGIIFSKGKPVVKRYDSVKKNRHAAANQVGD